MAGVRILSPEALRAKELEIMGYAPKFQAEQAKLDPKDTNTWGKPTHELSEMTHSLSLIASNIGDAKTSRLLGQLSVGFSQLSIGMSGLSAAGGTAAAGGGSAASAGSLGALSAAGPYIAIAAGAMMIGSALFGGDDDNGLAAAFEAIFAALQQIGKMVEQVLKNQEKMFGVMQVTLAAVRDLETRVALNHDEMKAVTDFIKTEKLQSKLMLLQEDLSGTSAAAITTENKRKALNVLSAWLRQHLKHPSMNRLSSAAATPKVAVEILNEYGHSPWMMIGFIVAQLKMRLGSIIPAEYLNLPPLPLFMCTARTFLLARAKAKDIASPDACESICNDIAAQIDQYKAFIPFLKRTPIIWNAMYDQYDHQRNMVGRAISNVSVKNNDKTLSQQVTDELKRAQLMQSLDNMEAVRLLLRTMVQLLGLNATDPVARRVAELDSKRSILKMTGKRLHADQANLHAGIKDLAEEDMLEGLRVGADVNAKNFQKAGAIYHLAHVGHEKRHAKVQHIETSILDLSHCLSTTTHEREINWGLAGRKPHDNGTWHTWWGSNKPSRIALNDNTIGMAFVQLACGVSINLCSENDGGLFYDYPRRTVKSREHMSILSAVKSGGKLESSKLQAAYHYYRVVEHGELAQMEAMRDEIDPICLLWVVAFLGKWRIFETLRLPTPFTGFAEKIDSVTPLMIAAKYGRKDVVQGLIDKHAAGEDVQLLAIDDAGDSAAKFAYDAGYPEIAKHLHRKGVPFSADLVARLPAANFVRLAVPLRERALEVRGLFARAGSSPDQQYLTAMRSLLDHHRELFGRVLPRTAARPPAVPADVLSELRASRSENAELKAEILDMKRMMAQLLAAQGGFAFAPGAPAAPPPPAADEEEAKVEPVAHP